MPYDAKLLIRLSATRELTQALLEIFPAAFGDRRLIIDSRLLKGQVWAARRIERALSSVRGIDGVGVDTQLGRIVVDYDAASFEFPDLVQRMSRSR